MRAIYKLYYIAAIHASIVYMCQCNSNSMRVSVLDYTEAHPTKIKCITKYEWKQWHFRKNVKCYNKHKTIGIRNINLPNLPSFRSYKNCFIFMFVKKINCFLQPKKTNQKATNNILFCTLFKIYQYLYIHICLSIW